MIIFSSNNERKSMNGFITTKVGVIYNGPIHFPVPVRVVKKVDFKTSLIITGWCLTSFSSKNVYFIVLKTPEYTLFLPLSSEIFNVSEASPSNLVVLSQMFEKK